MRDLKIIALCALWIPCGVVAAGGMNADFRADVPYSFSTKAKASKKLRIFLTIGLIGGPFDLAVVSICSGMFYNGWTFTSEPIK